MQKIAAAGARMGELSDRDDYEVKAVLASANIRHALPWGGRACEC